MSNSHFDYKKRFYMNNHIFRSPIFLVLHGGLRQLTSSRANWDTKLHVSILRINNKWHRFHGSRLEERSVLPHSSSSIRDPLQQPQPQPHPPHAPVMRSVCSPYNKSATKHKSVCVSGVQIWCVREWWCVYVCMGVFACVWDSPLGLLCRWWWWTGSYSYPV